MSADDCERPAEVAVIGGASTLTSVGNRLAVWIAQRLGDDDREVVSVLLCQIAADALVGGDLDDASLAAVVRLVAEVRAIVLVTPIRLGTFSGPTTLLLEALPPDALRDKIVLPIGVGTPPSHATSFECALASELLLLGCRDILPAIFVDEGEPTDRARIDQLSRSLNSPAKRLKAQKTTMPTTTCAATTYHTYSGWPPLAK